MAKDNSYKLGTKAIHGGYETEPTTMSCGVPLYLTSSYLFRDTSHAARLFELSEPGNIYSRLQNPTCQILERRLAELDGGSGAVTLASGMAAISAAVFTLTKQGDNIVSSQCLYGGTVTLFGQTLPRYGVNVRFFDPENVDTVEPLIDSKTRAVYMETIGNPINVVPDFERIAEIAHRHNVPVIVDNTVATACLFKPLEHGADIVVYSTTKFIGGHGTHLGGAVVDGGFNWAADRRKWADFTAPDAAYHGIVFSDLAGPATFVEYIRTHWLRDTGGAMSPFAAWIFLQCLETLHLRVPQHSRNAQAVAEFLNSHPFVDLVNYPGLPGHGSYERAQKYLPNGKGGIIGFGIKGGRPAGEKFINAVKLASHLANIGDAKTLVIHPASTTHQQLSEDELRAAGVKPEFIRLSVGIEDIDDIIADLRQALEKSQK
ncbi:MAG TPA: aminotransferase class I/II-fold pyridoxal phosphate-dependent enzyme [Phycisphaerae bacterium]|nr:aminotransferase class I/II-fold pyridoxal phosphate-dependent enzyme [Phycisphaerae bacterium]